MIPPSPARSRLRLASATALVVALGLAVKFRPGLVSGDIGSYLGDALWSMTVFLGWAFLQPAGSTRYLAFAALATAFLIEFSQLYQAAWLNAIRSTTPGYLVLGTTFSWGDLPGYAIGIALAAGLDSRCGKCRPIAPPTE